MSKAEDLLEQAQVAFRLANCCSQKRSVEHYSEMARDYLRQSHEAADIVELRQTGKAGAVSRTEQLAQ